MWFGVIWCGVIVVCVVWGCGGVGWDDCSVVWCDCSVVWGGLIVAWCGLVWSGLV